MNLLPEDLLARMDEIRTDFLGDSGLTPDGFARIRAESRYGQDPRVEWGTPGILAVRGRHGEPWLVSRIASRIKGYRWALWQVSRPDDAGGQAAFLLPAFIGEPDFDRPDMVTEELDDALTFLLDRLAA